MKTMTIKEAKIMGKHLGEIKHLQELIVAFKDDADIKAFYENRLKEIRGVKI